MEVQGRLISKLPEASGVSSKGEWKKQEAIIETIETYPKKICITFWGEKVDELKSIPEGTTIKAYINIESREYNGRWYTDVRAWKIETEGMSGSGSVSGSKDSEKDEELSETADLSPSDDGVDDLPF
ncbi:MAG: DUF3127 domain-containing protein [Flavobacteriales bacterium]|nr:DUF3127 domain-containing protein [Flavobacteriales bacterium]